MLDKLDPGMGYADWVRVGMALHAGGYPFEMFDRWSAEAPCSYDASMSAAVWRNFHPDRGVTMGTLYAMAWAADWRPETTSHAARIASRPGAKSLR